MVVGVIEQAFPDWNSGVGRPRSLSAVQVLGMTWCRLRRTVSYAKPAADFGVSTSTAWAYLQPMVAFLADQLSCAGDDLPGLVAGKTCLVDGTLLPTFNWQHRRQLFNFHRRRYGMTIQLLVDLHGFRPASWVELVAGSGGGIADLGYERAPDPVTPVKKPAGAELDDANHQFNTRLAKIRVAVERGVAHLKNWRILATRYHSDPSRINTDIQAVIGLQQLNEQLFGQRPPFDRIKTTGLSE